MAEIIVAEFTGRINLTGRTFGRLSVLHYVGYKEGKCRNHYYQCRCECGNELAVSYGCLTGGRQVSCGCKRGERHGLSHQKMHRVWVNILGRCLYQSVPAYKCYGGRGIQICDRYRGSLLAFVGDMGQPPFEGATVDRENNEGHYSCGKCEHCQTNGWPFNLRWATCKQQARNMRRNHVIEIDGVSKPLSAWLEQTGMYGSVFHRRIARGWSERDAILTPPRKYGIKSQVVKG